MANKKNCFDKVKIFGSNVIDWSFAHILWIKVFMNEELLI